MQGKDTITQLSGTFKIITLRRRFHFLAELGNETRDIRIADAVCDGLLSNERDKLAQIDRALARIDDGTYGVCESCGNPIGKMRLMAFPRATLCLTCKQREERR